MSEAPKRIWVDRWPTQPDVRGVVSYVFQVDQKKEGDVAYVRADEHERVKAQNDMLLAFIRDDLSDLSDAVGGSHWLELRRQALISACEESPDA